MLLSRILVFCKLAGSSRLPARAETGPGAVRHHCQGERLLTSCEGCRGSSQLPHPLEAVPEAQEEPSVEPPVSLASAHCCQSCVLVTLCVTVLLLWMFALLHVLWD